jgi:iron complex transport system substrate-binding protein
MRLWNAVACASVLCGLMVLSGCSWTADTPTAVTQETSTRTEIDKTGTSVTMPSHPKRVVILNTANIDMYLAVEGTIVGRMDAASLTGELQEKVKDIPSVGNTYNPDVEKIISLHPDLVIGMNIANHIKLREALTSANIPLYINDLDSFEDVNRSLQLFGELTNHPDISKVQIEKINTVFSDYQGKIKDKPHPKTLLLLGTPGNLNVSTDHSFSGKLLDTLGADNIGKYMKSEAPYVPLSLEFIQEQNPERIIFVVMYPDPSIKESFLKEMQSNPAWQHVKAVETGQIHYVPGGLFALNPGTRITQTLELMYKALYE